MLTNIHDIWQKCTAKNLKRITSYCTTNMLRVFTLPCGKKDERERCIDDDNERQLFKTAKRPQAPSDATVRTRFFRDNFVIFFVVNRKE